jgi:hypothetical protein
MNAKRIIANSLIAVGLAVLTYVASWVVGLVQAAKAAADAGQRATAGPLLVWDPRRDGPHRHRHRDAF